MALHCGDLEQRQIGKSIFIRKAAIVQAKSRRSIARWRSPEREACDETLF
jgi:hypothetical protein